MYHAGLAPSRTTSISIDDNLPDLSGIPEFGFARFFSSGYGHRHSGSLNCFKIIFQIFWVKPFSSMISKLI